MKQGTIIILIFASITLSSFDGPLGYFIGFYQDGEYSNLKGSNEWESQMLSLTCFIKNDACYQNTIVKWKKIKSVVESINYPENPSQYYELNKFEYDTLGFFIKGHYNKSDNQYCNIFSYQYDVDSCKYDISYSSSHCGAISPGFPLFKNCKFNNPPISVCYESDYLQKDSRLPFLVKATYIFEDCKQVELYSFLENELIHTISYFKNDTLVSTIRYDYTYYK